MTLNVLAVFVFLLLPPGAAAEGGRTAAILMQQPFGARAFTLGQAYSALGDDVFGLAYNPATLGRLLESQGGTQVIRSVGQTRLGYLGFATPLSPSHALGLGVAYLDTGRTSIFDSNGVETESRTAQRDLLINLGYAHTWPLGAGRLHAGLSSKLLKTTLAEELNATAYAADIGTIYELRVKGGLASFGAAASHLGPGLKYTGGLATGSETDPLPATYRAAVGYMKRAFRSDAVSLGIQFDQVPSDELSYMGAGLEYRYRGVGALRAGYRHGQDNARITFGAGIALAGLSFDYGIGLGDTLNDVHQLSLTYRFSIPGIKYAEPLPEARTPVEALAQRAREAIRAARFFDAWSEMNRLDVAFPNNTARASINAELAAAARKLSEGGIDSPGYAYAAAFRDFQRGDWEDAISSLELAKRKNPDSREVADALDQARRMVKKAREQEQLSRQARNATLFELANKAFESGDHAQARTIVNTILGFGPYQPAQSLRRKLDLKAAKPEKKAPAKKKGRRQRAKLAPPPYSSTRSSADALQADRLYNEAMRQYLRGELEAARENLRNAARLNPDSENVRNFLTSVEKTLKPGGGE